MAVVMILQRTEDFSMVGELVSPRFLACFASIKENNSVAAAAPPLWPFDCAQGRAVRAFGPAFVAWLKPGPSVLCLNKLFA